MSKGRLIIFFVILAVLLTLVFFFAHQAFRSVSLGVIISLPASQNDQDALTIVSDMKNNITCYGSSCGPYNWPPDAGKKLIPVRITSSWLQAFNFCKKIEKDSRVEFCLFPDFYQSKFLTLTAPY
jgi:hypothetical protein